MATIPDNQQRIYMLLKDLERDNAHLPPHIQVSNQATIDSIRACVVDCNRRRPKYKAPIQSDPMSLQKKIQILQMVKRHPDWTMQKVGHACNVIAGRVSETLRGKRK